MTTWATEPAPSPLAADGVVSIEATTRTLVVRMPDKGDSYARTIWRQGHQALLTSEQHPTWPGSYTLWAHTATKRQIAFGLPGESASLRFAFPVRGDESPSTYTELVSKPGLTATVILDRSAQTIMSVKFHHRRTAV